MNKLRELAKNLLFQSYQTDESFLFSPQIAYERAEYTEKYLARHFGLHATEDYEQTSTTLLDCDILPKKNYIDQLIRIALHLSQRTYSGYYSLSFNAEVREIPLSEDVFQILPQISKEHFYPELYENDLLTLREKNSLIDRHNYEFSVLKKAFLEAIDSYTLNVPQFFRKHDEILLEDADAKDAYSQCYNQVCIKEEFKITKSLRDLDTPTFSSPALTQVIMDGLPGQILKTYCLPTKDLLISIAKNEINPLTGAKYSSSAVSQVRSNFSTELKLIEYALRISPKVEKAPYSLTQTAQAFMYQESKSPRNT